jgi:ABC-type nickel/cobalt efflux system permease component RcnA
LLCPRPLLALLVALTQKLSLTITTSSLTITSRDYNEVSAGESVDDESEQQQQQQQQQHEENGGTATTTSLEPEHSSEAKGLVKSHHQEPAADEHITVDEAIERFGLGKFQFYVLTAAGLCFASDAMRILLLSFLCKVLKSERGFDGR